MYENTCEKVTDDMYTVIILKEKIHWFCSVCESKAIYVLKLVAKLKSKNDEIDVKVKDVIQVKNEEFKENRE